MPGVDGNNVELSSQAGLSPQLGLRGPAISAAEALRANPEALAIAPADLRSQQIERNVRFWNPRDSVTVTINNEQVTLTTSTSTDNMRNALAFLKETISSRQWAPEVTFAATLFAWVPEQTPGFTEMITTVLRAPKSKSQAFLLAGFFMSSLKWLLWCFRHSCAYGGLKSSHDYRGVFHLMKRLLTYQDPPQATGRPRRGTLLLFKSALPRHEWAPWYRAAVESNVATMNVLLRLTDVVRLPEVFWKMTHDICVEIIRQPPPPPETMRNFYSTRGVIMGHLLRIQKNWERDAEFAVDEVLKQQLSQVMRAVGNPRLPMQEDSKTEDGSQQLKLTRLVHLQLDCVIRVATRLLRPVAKRHLLNALMNLAIELENSEAPSPATEDIDAPGQPYHYSRVCGFIFGAVTSVCTFNDVSPSLVSDMLEDYKGACGSHEKPAILEFSGLCFALHKLPLSLQLDILALVDATRPNTPATLPALLKPCNVECRVAMVSYAKSLRGTAALGRDAQLALLEDWRLYDVLPQQIWAKYDSTSVVKDLLVQQEETRKQEMEFNTIEEILFERSDTSGNDAAEALDSLFQEGEREDGGSALPLQLDMEALSETESEVEQPAQSLLRRWKHALRDQLELVTCPITYSIMQTPVFVLAHGPTKGTTTLCGPYEKSAVLSCYENASGRSVRAPAGIVRDPLTRLRWLPRGRAIIEASSVARQRDACMKAFRQMQEAGVVDGDTGVMASAKATTEVPVKGKRPSEDAVAQEHKRQRV